MLPVVTMTHLFSPSTGIVCPLATSYSPPLLDASFGCNFIDTSILDGSTVSHAPESMVISISTHSSPLGALGCHYGYGWQSLPNFREYAQVFLLRYPILKLDDLLHALILNVLIDILCISTETC